MSHSSDDRMNDLLPTVDQSAHESLDAIATAVARGTALADIPAFDCLDTGAGRAVGTVAIDGVPDDVVVKVARPCLIDDPYASGLVQNAIEAHIDTAATPLSTLTLPLIATADGTCPRWLAVPRVPVADDGAEHDLFGAWDQLEALGFHSDDLFTPDNWGFFDGQPYLIDFGYAHPDTDCELSEIARQVDAWRTVAAFDDRLHQP